MTPRRRVGLDGLAFLEERLGLPWKGWALEGARLSGAELELELVSDLRRAAARVTRGPGGACRLEEPLEGLQDRLSGVSLPGLLARLERDSLHHVDPFASGAVSRFERYYRPVDHSASFWKFFYPLPRFLEQETVFGRRCARVSHATLECRLNNPGIEIPALRFFVEPQRARGDPSSHVETSLSEADVVGGRTQRVLEETLERVAREDRPVFVHLQTTCLPELIGDNPSAVIRKLEAELGTKVLWTSKTLDAGDSYGALIARLLDSAGRGVERDERSVVLAGVSSAAAGREAAALLGGLGLRVVGELFPRLDDRVLEAAAGAGAVVWLDPVGWEKISDAHFLSRGMRVVRYRPPFGEEGTRRWLERVAAVLGLQAPSRPSSDAALDALAERCRDRTAALVGDAADIEALTAPGPASGFSVAGLLCELGFRVRCLVWSGGRRARALRAPARAVGRGGVEFVPFASPRQLDRLLGRGVDLAFSHFNHDPRLASHAIPGFTEADFEPGVEGLARAGRRLLERCAARPFPRHRRWLSSWLT